MKFFIAICLGTVAGVLVYNATKSQTVQIAASAGVSALILFTLTRLESK